MPAKSSPSLLQSSWEHLLRLLQTRWQAYLWYLVLRWIIAGVTIALVVWALSPFISDFLSQFRQLEPSHFLTYIPQFLTAGVLLIIGSLFGMLVQFGFLRVVIDPKADQSLTGMLSKGADRFWWTFLMNIVVVLLLVLMLIPGYLLFIIPGVYLTVVFSWSILLVVVDYQGPLDALKESFQLVKGRWWKTFGTVLFWLILGWVLIMATNLLFGAILGSVVEMDALETLGSKLDVHLGGARSFEEVITLLSKEWQTFVSAGLVTGMLISGALQSLVSIVPAYGLLGTYKTLKGIK